MKGNDKIIDKLNLLLADELTAINQYMVHAEMGENRGYDKLHDKIQERAIVEMRHAEKLIARIIFLEGKPTVSILNPIHIGADVENWHKNDWQAEFGAIKGYNEGVELAGQVSDNGTRDILESILGDEEGHIDWIEAQLDQISQIGIQGYLTEQID